MLLEHFFLYNLMVIIQILPLYKEMYERICAISLHQYCWDQETMRTAKDLFAYNMKMICYKYRRILHSINIQPIVLFVFTFNIKE